MSKYRPQDSHNGLSRLGLSYLCSAMTLDPTQQYLLYASEGSIYRDDESTILLDWGENEEELVVVEEVEENLQCQVCLLFL